LAGSRHAPPASVRRAGDALTHQRLLLYRRPVPATAPDLARAAALFHALADETRLALLGQLGGGERCVCELQDALGAAQSRLSFHLKVLKAAGLVTDRREGRWAYYALAPEALAEAGDLVGALAPERAGRRARLRPLGDCRG
jgi:ArsR family transcriptional regulator